MSRILILCTGNSCRSQMAEYILRSLDASLEVFSAGTRPASRVHPLAVEVMSEIGLDMSGASPKNVDLFTREPFDVVITVCDQAKESCPAFTGNVHRRMHVGFDDPAGAIGSVEERKAVFRRVRDEIRNRFQALYSKNIFTMSREPS